MIRPYLEDDALLENIRQAALERPEELHLWWLGQSGYLIQWQNRHLLIDPYLSDSLTRKYAATDKPHVRLTEIPIAPERLNFIDLVTTSHNHTDHTDPDTLLPLLRANPELQIICPEANRDTLADRLNLATDTPLTLNAGRTLSAKGFTIHAVPAAHNQLDTDSSGRHCYLGYIIEAGPWRIYHSGDTKWYPDIVPNVQRFQVHLALLPINGDAPERRVAGNLSGPEAANLGKQVGAELVIPCHYDMFEFNTASTEPFIAECNRLQQPYRILQCAEPWSTAELGRT